MKTRAAWRVTLLCASTLIAALVGMVIGGWLTALTMAVGAIVSVGVAIWACEGLE